jgi:putative transcriptional regulator
MKSAFDKIAAGFEDAIGYAKGDAAAGRETVALDVKAIRKSTNLTQEQFSATYRLPLGSVRDWEQKRFQPDGASRTLLAMIAADPAGVKRIIAKV